MSDNELSGVEGLYQFTAQNVSVPSNTFEWGASVLVTGQGQGDYFYQEASDFDDTVEDIPISLVVRPLGMLFHAYVHKSIDFIMGWG